MRIIIPGGAGQVGSLLARAFASAGDEVVIIGRTPAPRVVLWDGRTLGEWARHVDGADVVINLAGRSVNCRYNAANRREIMNSRTTSTRIIGEAIAQASSPPRLWLQASTATIYRHRFDAANDELAGELGGNEPGAPDTWNFSIDVAKAWEATLDAADTPRTRKVAMRSAMIMSPDRNGIFDTLLLLVRRGLGGPAGSWGRGPQYMSWVHDADFVRAVRFLMSREDLDGPVNISSPDPLPNRDFMRHLRAAWRARGGLQTWGGYLPLPATSWMVEIGTRLMRTESELPLKSRRVIPGRLLNAGFNFNFTHWRDAAIDLCKRWPS